MAPARMHVNSDSSLLDEVLGLRDTSLDDIRWQGFRSFGHNGQPDNGDGTAA